MITVFIFKLWFSYDLFKLAKDADFIIKIIILFLIAEYINFVTLYKNYDFIYTKWDFWLK